MIGGIHIRLTNARVERVNNRITIAPSYSMLPYKAKTQLHANVCNWQETSDLFLRFLLVED